MQLALNAKRTPHLSAGRAFYVRAAWIAAAVGLLLADARAWLLATSSGFVLPPLGGDFTLYREAALRPGFYSVHQLAGPYDVWEVGAGNVLYPPTAIPLFAAFNVLPGFLWWAIPLSLVGWAVAYHRPRPLALLVIAGLALWPATVVNVGWSGNPSMWCIAALALATTGRTWAAPLILLKPTLGPFALWGVRSRAWWIGLAVFGVVSLAFRPLWADYLTVLMNGRNGSWLYQLWGVPAMLVPLIARFTSASTARG